jgi:mycofactocin precursor
MSATNHIPGSEGRHAARTKQLVGTPDARQGAPADDPPPGTSEPSGHVEQDLLVEDVSIDGMCGVY